METCYNARVLSFEYTTGNEEGDRHGRKGNVQQSLPVLKASQSTPANWLAQTYDLFWKVSTLSLPLPVNAAECQQRKPVTSLLSYLLVFEAMPRTRNWRHRTHNQARVSSRYLCKVAGGWPHVHRRVVRKGLQSRSWTTGMPANWCHMPAAQASPSCSLRWLSSSAVLQTWATNGCRETHGLYCQSDFSSAEPSGLVPLTTSSRPDVARAGTISHRRLRWD